MSTGRFRRSSLSDEDRAARMDAAHQALVEAVQTLATSDDWLALLETARRLPSYSPRNCLLLASQGAKGMVMGYQAWRQIPATEGGTCQVARGAKGLKVLAPVTRSVTDADPVTGQEVRGSRVVGFRLISVFDQTSLISPPDLPGQEVMTPVVLDGEAPARLWDALAAQVTAAGYHLDTSSEVAARIGTSKGRTDFLARIVCVRPDLPTAQQVKTLAHELAHVHLHDPGTRPVALSRAMAEVEAESAAYLITAELGLDSSAYTIPYVAGWSGGDTDAILGTAHRAITTARTIIDEAHLYLTPTDLPGPARRPPTAAQGGAPAAGVHSETGARTGLPLHSQPGPDHTAKPDTDGWPDFLDDIAPVSPSIKPAGHSFGETSGELSPPTLGEVRDETGVLDGVVLGTATGAWRLRWEPTRAALTAVHLTGPDDPGAGYVSRTLHVDAHPDEAASIGSLEEHLGFALPTSVRDHLTSAQASRPATLTPTEGVIGASGGQRNFTALYPPAPTADDRIQDPAELRNASDERVTDAERPLPSSLVLIPGSPSRSYAVALAEGSPLRSWTSGKFGIQILSATPDPDFAGHQAITYRVTHDDLVIVSTDDLLAPLGTDPSSDLAVRHAALLAAGPPAEIRLTPAQAQFAHLHAATLTALTQEPEPPYPPDTRVRVSLPTTAQPAAPGLHERGGGDTSSVTGTVVQPISEDGGPVTSYAWRPDTVTLPGHPWVDNPGHALISPAHQIQPTLAAPDTGLAGWTPDVPLAYGAQISFPADDASPIGAVVLRALNTSTGLAYDVQPATAGTSPLRIPAHEVTAVRGTAWPTARALLTARENDGLPLQTGEVLHIAGQTSHVVAGPDGPHITQAPPQTTHPLTNRAPQAERPGISEQHTGHDGLDHDHDHLNGETPPCTTADCTEAAAVTVSIGWPSGYREITNRCRPCAAQLTLARLPRGCGIDISPLPDSTSDQSLPSAHPATASTGSPTSNPWPLPTSMSTPYPAL